ncbi:acyl-homoserine-lactone synthase [Verminephrobacter aporrectodeae]|uniref:acyl-homoserine-lactone synthase n=1 Tax=Verminephrobacter aporrectodeae TaxID=1110389 RepID=UPI0022433809|nr:acyl-homoserine-lactone synthase [Verminephrobacter aporrectodeae]MCW8175951.1 N-acylhomoserine lactone synthase [Verminephrobacter aporrectodeae subsp. tuberculatae]MCW8201496.1 N-acylhomoserine lactone synthase [Verminephrobacter aporrectodeae subsp. tuberculatae]MCW8209163.1 N-acylhomoserine lactone synthase [Verminephrobacter aporrectodeae subsp. tuberculatae]
MLFVSGRCEELHPRHMEDVGRYRHKVFIDHLGWPLHSSNGIELDEFDGGEAIYISSYDENNQINGVARLLPTTVPYLLEKVFPALWESAEFPHDVKIWELSRFAAMDFISDTSFPHQASAKHASKFFRQVVEVAKKLGVCSLITVSPIGMERLLRLNGFESIRTGSPAVYGGRLIVSLLIHC